jgi:hypothetical protein
MEIDWYKAEIKELSFHMSQGAGPGRHDEVYEKEGLPASPFRTNKLK